MLTAVATSVAPSPGSAMPATEYLLEQLVRSHRLSAAEVDRVRAWVARSGEPTTTAAFLRAGMLDQTTVRALALIQKGFMTASDPALLLLPDQLERLRTCDLPDLGPVRAEPAVAVAELPEYRTERCPVPAPPSDPRLSDTTPRAADRTAVPTTHPTEPVSSEPAEAAARAERPAVAVGALLGKCLLTGVLGHGGRGVVYSALHTALNIPVAVKVITAEDRDSEDLQSELQQEARLLARLNHPNVVRVLDFDCTGVPYVVMEMVDGSSLAELIVQTGGLRPERAAEVVLQAAHGLSAAWELGVVHRDIKPANLLLTRDGTVRIADLGLALAAGAPDRETGLTLGTCAYMAPEQARSAADVDFRADVYALGCTLYHAVTGRLPFDASASPEMLHKHATQTAPPAHEVAPGMVPQALARLIAKMMEKEPAARHASYSELVSELRAFLAGTRAPTKGALTQAAPVARLTRIMGLPQHKSPRSEAAGG